MIMDISKIQTDLTTKGYTHFNIINYNKQLYHYLLPLRCNTYTTLEKFMTGIRVDGGAKQILNDDAPGVHVNEIFKTFEEAKNKRIEATNKIAKNKLFQAWHFSQSNNVLTSRGLNIDTLNEYLFQLIKECFQLDTDVMLRNVVDTFTFFDTDCKIANHQDGNEEDRVCSLLIYLNQDYDINDGGCLVLENETIIPPLFGNVALISLDKKFNVNHQVTKVVGGMGRYALCFFIKRMDV